MAPLDCSASLPVIVRLAPRGTAWFSAATSRFCVLTYGPVSGLGMSYRAHVARPSGEMSFGSWVVA